MTIQQLALAILDEFKGIHKDDLSKAEGNLINRALTVLGQCNVPVDSGWNEHGEYRYTVCRETTPQ